MMSYLRRHLIAALAVTTLAASTTVFATRLAFDPASSVGSATVELGKDVETTIRMPIQNFLSADAKAEDITLAAVEGPAGVTAQVLERKIVTAADGTQQLELKLKVAAEAFKGTGAGAYPVMLTLDNAADENSRNVFLTLAIQ